MDHAAIALQKIHNIVCLYAPQPGLSAKAETNLEM